MKLDISPEVHRALAVVAAMHGVTMKSLADSILSDAIDSEVWELVRRGKCEKVQKEKSPLIPSDNTEVVEKAKRYILAELENGREPSAQEVAEAVGLNARPLGVLMRAEGIEARNTTRKGKAGRRYTLEMIEDFRRDPGA